MILWVAVGFLVVALLYSRILFNLSVFNPLVIFFLIWTFVLLLYSLDIRHFFFYAEMSQKAEQFLIISFFFFLFGYLTAAMYISKQKIAASLSLKNKSLKNIYTLTKFFSLIFFAGLAYKYSILLFTYGNIFDALPSIHEALRIGVLAYPIVARFLTLFSYLIILNLGILIFFAFNKKVVIFTMLIIIAMYFNDMTAGSRGSTFTGGLYLISIALVALVIKYKKLKFSHLISIVVVFLSIILLLTSIVYLRSDRTVSFMNRVLNDSYIYITGTLPSYSFFIDHPWESRLFAHNTIFGFYQLLDTILKFLSNNSLSILSPDDLRTYFAPITNLGPFNTTNYITYIYSDFGETGVILFNYFLGFISAYLYFKALKYKRIIDIQLSAIVVAGILFSPRGILTNGMSFWVTLIIVFIQHYYLRMNKNLINSTREENN